MAGVYGPLRRPYDIPLMRELLFSRRVAGTKKHLYGIMADKSGETSYHPHADCRAAAGERKTTVSTYHAESIGINRLFEARGMAGHFSANETSSSSQNIEWPSDKCPYNAEEEARKAADACAYRNLRRCRDEAGQSKAVRRRRL